MTQHRVYNIAPHPTTYLGVQFRSKLEACWAAFYTTLGIRWVYEPGTFNLPSGRYTPDFYLPDFGVIEIKPTGPTDLECAKIADMAKLSGSRGYLFFGPFREYRDGESPCSTPHAPAAYMYTPEGGGDNMYAWCICPICNKIGLEFDGRGGRICSHDSDDKRYTYDHPVISNAFKWARDTINFGLWDVSVVPVRRRESRR